MPKNHENPLGYWCAPNGCTPNYMAARDLKGFLGFGLIRSNTQARGWEAIKGSREDTRWLRKYFLDVVRRALDLDREDNPPGTLLEFGGDIYEDLFLETVGGDEVFLQWRYEGRCEDGTWCFVLFCQGGDDDVLWLADEAVADRQLASRIIDEAESAI